MPGYTDTPVLQNSQYRVHDADRPEAPTIVPPTASTQDAPGSVPSDATVLFDGSSKDGWVSVKDGSPCGWEVADGEFHVVPGTGDMQTEATFGTAHYHVEFTCPEKVEGKEGQGLGNSGVFIMGLYEFQVLDNWENPTYADGKTGSVYGQYPPLVNPSREPGQWQVYDILFTAPTFDGDELISPAYATVMLNGIPVHNHVELLGPTEHKILTSYKPHGDGPLKLQDHGDKVRFRNIWVRDFGSYAM